MEIILGSIKISGKRIAEKTRMALINWMYPTPTTGQLPETPTTGQLENIVG